MSNVWDPGTQATPSDMVFDDSRWRRAGATEDDITALRTAFLALSGEDQAAYTHDMATKPDDALRAELDAYHASGDSDPALADALVARRVPTPATAEQRAAEQGGSGPQAADEGAPPPGSVPTSLATPQAPESGAPPADADSISPEAPPAGNSAP